jgi:hypothetical protein
MPANGAPLDVVDDDVDDMVALDVGIDVVDADDDDAGGATDDDDESGEPNSGCSSSWSMSINADDSSISPASRHANGQHALSCAVSGE